MKFPILVILFCLFSISSTSPAAKHAHTHNINQERTQDGSYVHRDHNHISEDGEHHSEFDHEAILGSVKEAEEFDRLTPEESKRRLVILLTKMDLNNDREIDRHELHAWILRSFKMLSEEEAKERFEDADENDDGVVTWSEYLSDSYGIDSEEDPAKLSFEVKDGEEELIADDKVMFDAADANKDHFLNPQEFVVFSHPEEHPTMLPIILQQTLSAKDKNNDGFIDFQEFVGDKGLGLGHDKDWLLVEKDKFDNEYDKDNDGHLNSNEILAWVVPSNDDIAEEEVDHLFASSDDNHDNVLSFNEILEHHDTFVGSEVTDYGDHLTNIHQFNDEL